MAEVSVQRENRVVKIALQKNGVNSRKALTDEHLLV
jgi:hypothetical protein